MLSFLKKSPIPRVLPVVALLVFLISRIETTRDEHLKLLAKVPLGSGVKAIAPLVAEECVLSSSVHEKQDRGTWIHTEDRGEYGKSGISDIGAKPFTGTITLFVAGPVGNHTTAVFTFKKGILVNKDWGFLPG